MVLPGYPFANLITRKTQFIFGIIETSLYPVSITLKIRVLFSGILGNPPVAKTKFHLWILLLSAGDDQYPCPCFFFFPITVPNSNRMHPNIFPPFGRFSYFDSIPLVFI